MRKLSEVKNEDALELLADIIEPAAKIFADEKVKALFSNKEEKARKIDIVKYFLKEHPSSIVEILAVLNGTTKEEYSANIGTMIAQCIEILNDEELMSFFRSQGLMPAKTTSGSAMENIEETETV